MPLLAGVTVCVPLAASLPPQAPLALHAVAPVLDQVKVAGVPAAMLVGLTAMETVGAGVVAETLTLKLSLALEALSVLVPAKFAVSVPAPACVGVSAQVALPVLSVVAVQVALPRAKVTTWPAIPRAGAR